ncbi:MAG: glycosyltransferase family 4 protein [Patescibacteria group bacterium]
MKLLILTQKVDRNDPILGFFHRWIEEFSKHCEQIIVICLQKGEFDLPKNVRVLSLGKETGRSRLKYIWRFYKYIWTERNNYDKVFVHMNQEYVILGWKLWKILGKKIYLWRNHHAGNFITDLAALFCSRIFCTSKYSYTVKFRKTELMPVGIDTNLFYPGRGDKKIPHSILFLSRMAPVKRPEILIEALKILKKNGIKFIANFYGNPQPQDFAYYQTLKQSAAVNIFFYPGVPNEKTVEIYRSHQIFVNLSPNGMYDKTIFEAMACCVLSLSSNKNLLTEVDTRLIFKENDPLNLAEKLQLLLNLSGNEADEIRVESKNYIVAKHSLRLLAQKLHDSF